MVSNISLLDAHFQSLVEYTKEKSFSFGLLIGQSCSLHKNEQTILHWCPTLSPQDEEKVTSFSALTLEALGIHAAQVVRMLPGGVNIAGIFLSWPNATDGVTDSTRVSKTRQLLNCIHWNSVLPFTSKAGLEIPENLQRMVALTVSSNSSQHSLQSFSVVSSGALPEPAKLSVVKSLPNNLEFEYSHNVSVSLYPSEKSVSSNLRDALLSQLKPWASTIAHSKVVAEKTLCTHVNTNGIPKNITSAGLSSPIKCRILSPLPGVSSEGSDQTCAVDISGTVSGRAFVKQTCSLGCISSAVVSDVTRSLYTRWGLHCDSLLEDASLPATLHELPRRTLITGTSLEIPFYELLFPGDTASDAIESVRDLLNVDISSENVCTEVEKENFSSLDGSTKRISPSSTKSPMVVRPLHIQLAAICALLAILLFYMNLRS